MVHLITTFFSTAYAQFAFLRGESHARWIVRLRQTTPTGFVDTPVEQINSVFLASAEFANQAVTGEVTFGDKEYCIETVVGPAGHSLRYGLWEWADALDRPNLIPLNTNWVHTVARMEAIVSQTAFGLKALQTSIAAPDPAVVERIEHARTVRQEDFSQDLREDEHRRAVTAAAVAFRAKDYRRVVVLLESVHDKLTAAEREKLSFARKYV